MKLKITQIKSSIGYNKKAKLTMEALGIKKINSSVVHNDTPQIRGMIGLINYLLKIEEV
tara:strand:- start:172 stop:348 length:177 start_codon:yes stop_codon:yes gene_type:complete